MTQRLVIFLSIVGDIKVLYPPKHCSNYLRAPNKAFDGQSPLDLLTLQSIKGFTRVSAYLKGSILGGFSESRLITNTQNHFLLFLALI